jgi:hypothetical protein
MVERLPNRQLLCRFYCVGIEAQTGPSGLSPFLWRHGHTVGGCHDPRVLRRQAEWARPPFVAAHDLPMARRRHQTADLRMEHAFLDLLDLPPAVPVQLGLLRPGGLLSCYFYLNVDGVKAFEPAIRLARCRRRAAGSRRRRSRPAPAIRAATPSLAEANQRRRRDASATGDPILFALVVSSIG